jgi:hypothetical protein
MKVRLTLVAAALSMAFGVAYANDPVDPALITNKTNIENDIKVKGEVYVGGKIAVSAESSAVTDNSQDTMGNRASNTTNSPNDAGLSGGAASGAKGNIGINSAAGAGNAQSNQTAISSVDAKDVFASAQNFNTQKTSSNYSDNSNHSPNTASIGSGALQNVQGNVGVNVAAGSGNAQGNATSLAVGSNGVIAKATSTSRQTTTHNDSDNAAYCVGSPNNASISGGALTGAMGNIGVNVAAGAGNAQYNSLAMSTAVSACSTCK